MTGNRSDDPLGNYEDPANPNSVDPSIDGRYAGGTQGNGIPAGMRGTNGGANH